MDDLDRTLREPDNARPGLNLLLSQQFLEPINDVLVMAAQPYLAPLRLVTGLKGRQILPEGVHQ